MTLLAGYMTLLRFYGRQGRSAGTWRWRWAGRWHGAGRGGMWGYLRELRRMCLAVVRLFQRGSEREIAESVARCERDLERLKQAARFEEALFELDVGGRPPGRGGVPRSLLDPAAGGRGRLPPDWEPLDL